MKTSILLFSFLFTFVAFGQKNKVRSVPSKTSPAKPAVRTTSRPSTTPVSKPSRQPRPAVSRPPRPSSSSSSPSRYVAPSIQQYSTKHPAPNSGGSVSNSNRRPVGNSSGTSGASSAAPNTNGSTYVNYSSQSCGTNPNTGYYNSFGPMVGVSGTGFEYGRLARLTGGRYVKYPTHQVARAIQDLIVQNANDSTDIVILVDISGSMKNNVKDISRESQNIVNVMPFGSRLGGAVFKYSKSPEWFKYSDLNEDHYYALDFIAEKRQYNSSESHYDALLKVMDANSWKNRKRMVITITDEFIESGENYNSESTIVSAANAKNIELHTIMLNN